MEDSIEPTLQSKFETERLKRVIEECNDINIIKEIAMELLHLHEKKSAIVSWSTKRAAMAEELGLKRKFLLNQKDDN